MCFSYIRLKCNHIKTNILSFEGLRCSCWCFFCFAFLLLYYHILLVSAQATFISTPDLPLSLSSFLSLSPPAFVCPFSNSKYLSADRSKTLRCFWWILTVKRRRSRHQSPAAWLKHTIQQRRVLTYVGDRRTSRKPTVVASREAALEKVGSE